MKRRGFILGAMAAVVGAVVGRAKPVWRFTKTSIVNSDLTAISRGEMPVYGKAYAYVSPRLVHDEIAAMNGKHGVIVSRFGCNVSADGKQWELRLQTRAPRESVRIFTNELTARLKANGAIA